MLKRKNIILINQLDSKFSQFSPLTSITPPGSGWIKAIRMALNMSLRQLGKKLNTNIASTSELEKREAEGSITIKKLKEVALALDMKFFYGFVPNSGSLKAIIEKKAKELAEEIVLRTSQNMKLEEQQNSEERLKKAIEERTEEIKNELPKLLWD
jgi:predicted DNA-binding mobile mystery protein A